MKKKTLIMLLSLVLVFVFVSCSPEAIGKIAEGIGAVDNPDPQKDEACFDIDEDGVASLKAGVDLPQSLLIPQTVGGVAVTAVEECTGDFASVVIPGNVKTILDSAFYNCPNLTTVVIEDGVTTIEEDAFTGCPELTMVVINSAGIKIKKGAFAVSDIIEFVYLGVSYSNINTLRSYIDGV